MRPLNKGFHIFISYRVHADAELVEMLYDKLTSYGYLVWWDRMSLEAGTRWEDGFVEGLSNAACFVPVLSRGALASYAKLKEDSAVDNMLLEQVPSAYPYP